MKNWGTPKTLTVPTTFVAYTPGRYPSRRCQRATQLLAGSLMVINPSKTWLVQSWTVSGWLARPRKDSQFGQPKVTNFLREGEVSASAVRKRKGEGGDVTEYVCT